MTLLETTSAALSAPAAPWNRLTMNDDPRTTDRQPPISFRGRGIKRSLQRRLLPPHRSLGSIAKRDLERYYAVVEGTELPSLTPADWQTLTLALGGLEPGAEQLPLVWAVVDDYTQRHGVDTDLPERLRQLPLAAYAAILDRLDLERVKARSRPVTEPREPGNPDG